MFSCKCQRSIFTEFQACLLSIACLPCLRNGSLIVRVAHCNIGCFDHLNHGLGDASTSPSLPWRLDRCKPIHAVMRHAMPISWSMLATMPSGLPFS